MSNNTTLDKFEELQILKYKAASIEGSIQHLTPKEGYSPRLAIAYGRKFSGGMVEFYIDEEILQELATIVLDFLNKEVERLYKEFEKYEIILKHE